MTSAPETVSKSIVPQTERRWHTGSLTDIRLWLVATILLAFCLRLVGINFGLPLQLHPDESSQVKTALQMQNGDLNPHFFNYPTLFTYQLLVIDGGAQLFAQISHRSLDTSTYFLLGRLLSAAYGTLTVWAVFALGRLVFNEAAGLGTAVFLAISPEHVLESHFATVDIAMTFWAILACVLALKAMRAGKRSWVPVGVAVGLAVGTKYTALIVMPPLLCLSIWKIWRSQAPGWRWLGKRVVSILFITTGIIGFLLVYFFPRRAVLGLVQAWTTAGTLKPEYLNLFNLILILTQGMAIAAILFGLVTFWNTDGQKMALAIFHPLTLSFVAVAIGTFFLTSPFVLFDFPHAARDIFYEYRHMLLGGAALYPANDPVLTLVQPPGFFNDPMYYWNWWLGQNGLLVSLMACAGLVILARKNRAAFWITGTTSLILAITITRAANKAERYALLLVPILLLWAGVALVSMLGNPIAKTRRFFQAIAVFIVLIVPLLSTWNILNQEFIIPDTRVLAMNWMQAHVELGAVVVRENETPDLEDTPLDLKTIFAQGAFETKTLAEWKREGVQYILVGPIRNWYTEHANLYPREAQGYAELEQQGQLIKTFEAGSGASGPTIWIYKIG